jgi:hypothetical protein
MTELGLNQSIQLINKEIFMKCESADFCMVPRCPQRIEHDYSVSCIIPCGIKAGVPGSTCIVPPYIHVNPKTWEFVQTYSSIFGYKVKTK